MKKTLGEIRETQEVAHYITVATVVCIQAEYGWYYLSCKKCGKKVTKIEDKTTNEKKTTTKLYCMKCCVDVDAIPRYKLQVRVIDESGSASFVMFDREVKQILHKSAYELRESLAKDNDIDSFPEELNDFLDKKFLFKVDILDYNIKKNWQIYTVTKLSNDAELINSVLEELQDNNKIGAKCYANSGENEPSPMHNQTTKESTSVTGDKYNQSEGEGSQLTPTLKRHSEVSLEEGGLNMSSTKKRVVVKQEKDDN